MSLLPRLSGLAQKATVPPWGLAVVACFTVLTAVSRPAAASSRGPMPVIVVLRAAAGDRAAIAREAMAVVRAVDGRAQVRRMYTEVPALALELTALEPSGLGDLPQVAAVTADTETAVPPVEVAQGGAAAVGVSAASAAGAPKAWGLGLRGQGATVAIVDTGVAAQHPDLQGQVVAQQCFSVQGCPGAKGKQGPLASDIHGHGTHVAAIVAGKGKTGPLGVAPESKLVAVRVLGNTGKGVASDLLAGLDWLAQHSKTLQLDVVNLSLGGGALSAAACDANHPALAAAVQLLNKKGVVVVAAAGNGGSANGIQAPACLSKVLSVGATYAAAVSQISYGAVCSDSAAAKGKVACFSNRSKHLGLLAPGVPVLAAWPGGGLATLAGTSQAAPVVSGVVALLAPCWPTQAVSQLLPWLQASGTAVTDKSGGYVLRGVDAGKAAMACLPWS